MSEQLAALGRLVARRERDAVADREAFGPEPPDGLGGAGVVVDADAREVRAEA